MRAKYFLYKYYVRTLQYIYLDEGLFYNNRILVSYFYLLFKKNKIEFKIYFISVLKFDVDLVGSGTGTGTLSYAWDLDDDGQFDDSAEQNPQDVSFSAGSHTTIALQVTDDCGSTTDTATVTINLCVNNAPTITSITNKHIAQGSTFNFTVSANDPDGNKLYYEIVSGPSKMTINSNTGAISWVANCSGSMTSRCHIFYL